MLYFSQQEPTRPCKTAHYICCTFHNIKFFAIPPICKSHNTIKHFCCYLYNTICHPILYLS